MIIRGEKQEYIVLYMDPKEATIFTNIIRKLLPKKKIGFKEYIELDEQDKSNLKEILKTIDKELKKRNAIQRKTTKADDSKD